MKIFSCGYTRKRGDSYQLPVPRREAFALPDDVERATRSPRRWIYTAFPHCKHVKYVAVRHTYGCLTMGNVYKNIPWASIVAMSLTSSGRLRSFSASRTKRMINAFPI